MTKQLTSNQIRQVFLDFFENHHHAIVNGSSLIPGDDPTLLFSNAGMVQFKDVFLGLEKRPYIRAATSQKCMRVAGKHNDLENVGPSPRHHTFFEMLGNFSFGDYFKRESIRWGYELLTEGYGLDLSRLYYTVHESDDEAFDVWTKEIGIDPTRVYRMGDATNFWQMADVGPCGPTSEIHYDLGKEACTCGQADCSILLDNGCDRWLELWNLVFMQFNRDEKGVQTLLPQHGVDTGLGFERIVSAVQNKRVNYETDLFTPIINRIQELLEHNDKEATNHVIPYRVIADHGRAITFMIGDGVMPGNEGREYVLRLIIRRAARYGRMAGFREPFLSEIAKVVIQEMGHHYTELVSRQQFILNVIRQEEERFLKTFENGLTLLEELVKKLHDEGKTIIPGEDVFKLHATFGFPHHLTRNIAEEEYNFTIDEAGFHAAMAEHSQISGTGSFKQIDEATLSIYADLLNKLKENNTYPKHNPYTDTMTKSTIFAILRDGKIVNQATVGEVVEVVLDNTPFYVEAGGQIGDTGMMTDGIVSMIISDVRKPVSGLVIHYGQVEVGTIEVGQTMSLHVDNTRRQDIMRNHTATHLLHLHLRQVLGEHVAQAGSLVTPDRLRFDFSHPEAVSTEALQQIEVSINDDILANYTVNEKQQTYKEAVGSGAMALFGEKYADTVRVISIAGTESKELCGGTHVSNTGQIGSFLIVSEGSVAAGVRRIEAVTGNVARRQVQAQLSIINDLAAKLGITPFEVPDCVDNILAQVKSQQKEIDTLNRKLARADFETQLSQVKTVHGISVLAVQVQVDNVARLREMGDWFRDKLESAVVVLGTVLNGKPSLIAIVSEDLTERGLHAGKIVKEIAKVVDGSGGGRSTMAQAGGKDVSKLPEALSKVEELVAKISI